MPIPVSCFSAAAQWNEDFWISRVLAGSQLGTASTSVQYSMLASQIPGYTVAASYGLFVVSSVFIEPDESTIKRMLGLGCWLFGSTSSNSVSSAITGAPTVSARSSPRAVPVVVRITLFIVLSSQINRYFGYLVVLKVVQYRYRFVVAVRYSLHCIAKPGQRNRAAVQ